MRPLRTEHTGNHLGGDATGTQREAMCPQGPHGGCRASLWLLLRRGRSVGLGAAPLSLQHKPTKRLQHLDPACPNVATETAAARCKGGRLKRTQNGQEHSGSPVRDGGGDLESKAMNLSALHAILQIIFG